MPSEHAPARTWMFTLNNWTEEEHSKVLALECLYLVVGKEVGEQGTPHLQGCITMRKPIRRGALSALMPRARLEKADHVAAARKYCLKDNDFTIVDNRTQGKRTDLIEAIDMMKDGGLRALMLDAPEQFVKYHSGLEKLHAGLMPARNPAVPHEVIWLYGTTGLGKSRYVHEKEHDLWVSMGSHKWWQGYHQQPAILIDDMRCNYAPFNELLKILDIYPYTAEVKGSHVQVNSQRIYITSQFPPHKVYNREARQDEDIRQLYRRITKVYNVVHDLEPGVPVDDPIEFHGHWLVLKDKEALLCSDAAEASTESGAFAPNFFPFT